MSFYPRRAQEREKTMRCRCPICTAPMDLYFDATGGEGWEPMNDLPVECPKGHRMPVEVRLSLEAWFLERAQDGVGDFDARDLCGHTEAQS